MHCLMAVEGSTVVETWTRRFRAEMERVMQQQCQKRDLPWPPQRMDPVTRRRTGVEAVSAAFAGSRRLVWTVQPETSPTYHAAPDQVTRAVQAVPKAETGQTQKARRVARQAAPIPPRTPAASAFVQRLDARFFTR